MRFLVVIFLLLAVAIIIDSCRKKDALPEVAVVIPQTTPEFSDTTLFDLIADTLGRKFYKNNTDVFLPAGGSPHGNFRFWFNPKAQTALDTSGKLPISGVFPDSSLLMKEVRVSLSDPVTVFAVMYKLKGNWKWAEYGPSGNVLYSIKADPNACVSCHSNLPNRDLVRSFDLH